MSNQPMRGVRVLEVAQFTFTPAAGAILADWGADVIKVEHAVTGDAQRGLTVGTGGPAAGGFHPIMEHSNRGKRSIGLALEVPASRNVLYELVSSSDVFLTNFLPGSRGRLHIDEEDIKTVNPGIVYVRGSAHGPKGPDADKGGFDGSTFWCRGSSAMTATPPDSPRLIGMPGGGYGDSIGAMTIAGGVAAALFERERTGTAPTVDVSLLSVGTWAMGLSIDVSLLLGHALPVSPLDAPAWLPFNPVIGNFETADGRWISLSMLQAGRYWADLCAHIDREDLIGDERFNSAEGLIAHAAEAGAAVADAIASRPYDEWLARLSTLEGQWAPTHNSLEVVDDPQVQANGYIAELVDSGGNKQRLVASPVQFDEKPPVLTRGPQFAEHTDEILRELGRSDDEILQLKIDGAVT